MRPQVESGHVGMQEKYIAPNFFQTLLSLTRLTNSTISGSRDKVGMNAHVGQIHSISFCCLFYNLRIVLRKLQDEVVN